MGWEPPTGWRTTPRVRGRRQPAARHRDGGEAWIDWRAARAFADAGTVASTSEMAILDLAVALGENRYRLSVMGAANSRSIATAVARTVGMAR